MRTIELKIKIKSLADEQRTIRKEVHKLGKQISHITLTGGECDKLYELRCSQGGIFWHGHEVVRDEARCSLLAYGYLRGRAYKQMEATCREEPDWGKVLNIVKRFGGNTDVDAFEAWQLGQTWESDAA